MATYSDNLAGSAQGAPSAPVIRTIGFSDLHQALRLGWEDFKAVPSITVAFLI